MSVNIYDSTTDTLHKVAGLVDDTDLKQDIEDIQAVIPSEASASNKLVTESEISKTEKTLSIGGSASAIVKIDVSIPFLETAYGKFTEIDFQVRSDNIRFFISANDGTYLITAQHNYRSSGWLTGLNYLVNSSKSISLYVSILNYPANVGAKLVFNGLDGAEITEISRVDALPSGYATIKQSPVIYTADLTSTVTQGSGAPITSGGVYSDLNKTAESENTYLKATFSKSGRNIIVDIVAKQALAEGADYTLDIPNGFEPLAPTKSGYMHDGSGGLSMDRVVSLISVIKDSPALAFYTYKAMVNGAKGVCCYISAS